MLCLFAVSSRFIRRASLTVSFTSTSVTSPTDITQYCTVQSWYMRKRIDHWCSVVSEKSQPSGPPFSGKLGKPRFPLTRWALGLGYFCPHWTPMMDSIYLTRGLGKPRPWLNSDPEGEISLSYMDRLMMDRFSPTFGRVFVRT